MSDIEYLDFSPETHQLTLRERARAAFESRRMRVLCEARDSLQDMLGVADPAFTEVTVKNKDGDGDAFCEIDGLGLKVSVVYSAGESEPQFVKVWLRAGAGACTEIHDLADLGRVLTKNTPDPPAPKNFGLGTN